MRYLFVISVLLYAQPVAHETIVTLCDYCVDYVNPEWIADGFNERIIMIRMEE